MKQSDDLFDLIKSLKKTEKRYFKIYATRHSEQANSVKLFSALDKLEEYDEEQLRRIFKGEKFLEQLAVAKHYLCKIILESMTLYHSQASANLEVSHLLQQTEFLMNRGLIDQAAKKVAKAETIATRAENYKKMLECYSWERTILMKSNYKDLTSLFEKEKEVLNLLLNIIEYRQLSFQVYGVLKEAGRTPNEHQWAEIYNVLANPLLTDSSKALSFEAKAHFFNIHAGVHFVEGDTAKIYEYTKAHIELLEQNPARVRFRPKAYIDSLHNYLHTCLDMRYFDELEIGLEKLKRLPMDTPYMQEAAFITFHSLDLLMRLTTGDFIKGLESVHEIEEGFEKYPGLQSTEKVILSDRVIRLFLATGNPNMALKWVNSILNDVSLRNIRKDIYTSIKVLNVLIHLELKNYDFAQYLVKSDTRSFRKDSMSYLEYLTVRNIATLPVKNKKVVPPSAELFQKILNEYQMYCQVESEGQSNNHSASSFLPAWIESRSTQLPMEEVVRNRFSNEIQKSSYLERINA
ncbi:MAG: hypothetical protein HYZ54_08245 [Ignavibacteriae bacterium]|nr:hypothetical protein [Ignavibacteriota bacterium]